MVEKTITIRVDKSTKDKWKKRADKDVDYRDLTHLIKLSVERELSEQSVETSPSQVSAEVDLSPVHERLQGIDDKLDAIHDDVLEIEFAESEEPDTDELALDIYDILPRVSTEAELRDPVEFSETGATRERVIEETGVEQWLIEYYGLLDYEESDIRRALRKLMRDMGVERTERDAYSHYFIPQ